jgi:uncharacterized protein YjbI with pentapeptide repeats
MSVLARLIPRNGRVPDSASADQTLKNSDTTPTPATEEPASGRKSRTPRVQLTTLAALLAVLVSIATVWASMFNTNATNVLNRRGQIADRFTKAVEEMGNTSKDPNVRLGGIYALNSIVEDSPEDENTRKENTRTVKSVLTAFIRAQWGTSRDPGCTQTPPPSQAEDFKAAIKVLSDAIPKSEQVASGGRPINIDSRWENNDSSPLELYDACLPRADFSNGRLSWVTLKGADLRHARFENTVLKHAQFNGTKIEFAVFENADLTEARLADVHRTDDCESDGSYPLIDFQYARLNNAQINNTSLRGAFFDDADLSGATLSTTSFAFSSFAHTKFVGTIIKGPVNFSGVILKDIDLTGLKIEYLPNIPPGVKLDFSRAVLDGADLRNIDLTDADFSGADLRSTKLGGNNLTRVRYNETTEWPADFQPPDRYIPSAQPPAMSVDSGIICSRLGR